MMMMLMMLMMLMLMFSGVFGYDYDWFRLHRCVTPQQLRDTVLDYRENFPCLDCREHLNALLEIHPYPLDYVQTSMDCKIWVWMTHNLVNVRLNKPWYPFVDTQCLI